MSIFDQPYYALTKAHMSRIGGWPEQSKHVRIIWPLTMLAIILTLVGPQLIRLHDDWGDIANVIADIPNLLYAIIIFTIMLNNMLNADKMKMMLEKMEWHWKMIRNTSAVIILDKYTERGCYLVTVYSIYMYTSLVAFFVLSVSPIILDFVNPLNETRPKKPNFYQVEYHVDPDKNYWFIFTHGYIVMIVSITIIVALETIYIVLIVHACAFFEIVGFNLRLAKGKYRVSKKNAVASSNDCSYQKISDCIIFHNVAISFADQIEDFFSGGTTIVLGTIAILISVTGVQALINIDNLDMLVRLANLTVVQVMHTAVSYFMIFAQLL